MSDIRSPDSCLFDNSTLKACSMFVSHGYVDMF